MDGSIDERRGMRHGTYAIDILAVGFFILEWTVYAVTLERPHAAGQTARYTGSRSPCHPDDKNVEAAGRHFNRGQRAFFFALGYLGWFVRPWCCSQRRPPW
jgi:uncharacterized membrane protein